MVVTRGRPGTKFRQGIFKNDMPGPGLTGISEVCRGRGRDNVNLAGARNCSLSILPKSVNKFQ